MKAVDKGMSRVKKAMDEGKNPLSEAKEGFVHTCCWILGINSEERVDSIGKQALLDSRGNVWKTMNAITKLLDVLGGEAKNHKRDSPAQSGTTRAWDDMDALPVAFNTCRSA